MKLESCSVSMCALGSALFASTSTGVLSPSECCGGELLVELTVVCNQTNDGVDIDSCRTAFGDGVKRSGSCLLRVGLDSIGVSGNGCCSASSCVAGIDECASLRIGAILSPGMILS